MIGVQTLSTQTLGQSTQSLDTCSFLVFLEPDSISIALLLDSEDSHNPIFGRESFLKVIQVDVRVADCSSSLHIVSMSLSLINFTESVIAKFVHQGVE